MLLYKFIISLHLEYNAVLVFSLQEGRHGWSKLWNNILCEEELSKAELFALEKNKIVEAMSGTERMDDH